MSDDEQRFTLPGRVPPVARQSLGAEMAEAINAAGSKKPPTDDQLDEMIRDSIEYNFEGEPVLAQVLERFERLRNRPA